MNPIREKAEYWLTKGYFSGLRFCPKPVIYGTCRVLAALFYLFATQRRRITLNNLTIAFPEVPAKERKRIARAAYDHFGQLLAESAMILAGKISQSDLDEMVDGSEMEKLRALEQRASRGVLAITGHLGNFELLAHYTGSHAERQSHVVARKGSNQLIDDRIVTPMRESFGNKVIYKSRALPQIVRALKKNEHIGLLIDIKTNARQGVPVTFFGKQTLGLTSSAFLQIKLHPLVVPMTMVRIAPRKYKLVVNDPIEWSDNGEPIEKQIAELTQIHQQALENLIRQTPEQWLWMHNRWKNQ